MAEIARGDDEWSTKEEDSRDGSEKEIEGKPTLPTMPVVEKEMVQVEHDVPTGNITYFEVRKYILSSLVFNPFLAEIIPPALRLCN